MATILKANNKGLNIDYLLKPVEPQLLDGAMRKFHSMHPAPDNFRAIIESLVSGHGREMKPQYRNRFWSNRVTSSFPYPSQRWPISVSRINYHF
ncbi:hypothetical protein [Pedobacter hartonius]|uniref:Uncharacterized protein n=1 Tax=Pedobacter hartonius TaxID=425514 RepID=A0A1H4CM62_9SPHI|nr:hypothetical protein [Pedobacter hartonius]SEA61403.1 hypothetical protein SAMN05443550_104101 [Pedobacter hartonius]